ncbi:MAG: lytic transglycosylase domain-containing protein [Candidatus Pacearchaeota archaeon]
MKENELEEIGREGNYIIYRNEKEIVVCDKNNFVITRYNIRKEEIKDEIKKTIAILSIGFSLLSPFFFFGNKKNYINNLENKVIAEKNYEIEGKNNKINLEYKISYKNKEEEEFKKYLSEKFDKKSNHKYIPSYISNAFVKSVIYVESGYNPNVISNKKAMGLPQTYYSTWKEVFPNDSYSDFLKGIKDKNKSEEFVFKYCSLIDNILNEKMPFYKNLNNDLKLEYICAAYNWGIGNLIKNNFDLSKAPKETKNYIVKIKKKYYNLI